MSQATMTGSRILPWLKRPPLEVLLKISQFWLRQGLTTLGKRWVWERSCAPYFVWRDWQHIASTQYGARVHTQLNEFIEGRVFFFGVWEPQVTACFQRILRSGDVVVDVGANFGYYTLLCSRAIGPKGHVFAVEPSPRNRARLEANIQLNNSTNVTVIPFAAWEHAGQATLQTGTGGAGTASLREVNDTVLAEDVRLAPLDDLIPRPFHSQVKLIKIDVEGAEFKALLGATRILETASDLRIICEVDPGMERGFNGEAADVFEFLRARGFTPYELTNDYTPDGYLHPGRTDQPLKPLTDTPTDPTYVLFERIGSS